MDEFNQFRRAEGVDMNAREFLFDGSEQIEVVVERQIGIHAALHEDLGASECGEFGDFLMDLFFGKGVGIVVVSIATECTEGAASSADVGVVDVAVDDIGPDRFAVNLAAAGIGVSTKLWKRHRTEQLKTLLWSKASFSGYDR